MGEKWPMNFCLKMPDFHFTFRDLLHAVNLQHGTDALFPLRKEECWGFFTLKNPTASVGFEHANLGTKGQHGTSRPPTPLASYLLIGVTFHLRGHDNSSSLTWELQILHCSVDISTVSVKSMALAESCTNTKLRPTVSLRLQWYVACTWLAVLMLCDQWI